MENRAYVPAPLDICSAYPRGVSEMFDLFTLYERAIEARLAEIERGTTYNQMLTDKYKELFQDGDA